MNIVLLRSLRARLISGAVIWISVGVSVAGFFIAALFQEHATTLFDAELRGHLEELSSIVDVDTKGTPHLYRRLSEPRFSQLASGYYWQVSRAGRVLIKSTSLSLGALPVPDDPLAAGEVHQLAMTGPRGPMVVYERLLSIGNTDVPMRLQVNADLITLTRLLRTFNLSLAGSLALLAIGLIVAASLQVAFGLQPMSRLRSALAAIRAGRAARLPRTFPLEVQPIVDDLNGMLELNTQIVQRARAQAGNLAHGLKTPLAILTDEASRLENRGERQAAAVIQQQCQRMQRQIDYQIARARAAASRSMPGVIAPVGPNINNIVAAMKRLYAAKALAIDMRVDEACVVACDPMDLGEMLANLLDNSCKWAAGRVRVTGKADEGSGHVVIGIEDDGPSLPPEAMEVVFQIGKRLDERVPGSGLGLPIVRDLAQLYGGAIRLEQSPLGGLKAVLTLPHAH